MKMGVICSDITDYSLGLSHKSSKIISEGQLILTNYTSRSYEHAHSSASRLLLSNILINISFINYEFYLMDNVLPVISLRQRR